MLKIKLIGIGAAGNKAAIAAFEQGAIAEDQLMLVNSNLGDVPQAYKKFALVLSDKMNGTGKERKVAKNITIDYLDSESSKRVDDFVEDADLVCIVNSTEGGTGSGSSIVFYKYLLNVSAKNVMGFVFTGFEEDGRGLKNTVEFFQDADTHVALQIISNKKFLPALGKNKLKAELLANQEFVKRLRIISGQDIHESLQNIDDTDLLKLVSTNGYMLVEHMVLNSEPTTTEQFNQLVDDMMANSKSLATTSSCKRMGVVISVSDTLKSIVDYRFETLIKKYGTPYEIFTHVQAPTTYGNEFYVIAAGLDMPLEEVKSVYKKFEEKVQQVAKENTAFTDTLKEIVKDTNDSTYDLQYKEEQTPEELLEKKKQFAQKFQQ